MYRECAAAAKYENHEDDEVEEEADKDPTTTEEADHSEAHTDEEVTSEHAANEGDANQEPELNNELGRQFNLRHLIMLRADQ